MNPSLLLYYDVSRSQTSEFSLSVSTSFKVCMHLSAWFIDFAKLLSEYNIHIFNVQGVRFTEHIWMEKYI